MTDSVRSHRWQPTRLLHPWDSPGKNTRVGCHFLLQYMKVKSESEVSSVVCDSSRPHGLQLTRLLRPWDFPGKSTGVGCHCLLSARCTEVGRILKGPWRFPASDKHIPSLSYSVKHSCGGDFVIKVPGQLTLK